MKDNKELDWSEYLFIQVMTIANHNDRNNKS